MRAVRTIAKRLVGREVVASRGRAETGGSSLNGRPCLRWKRREAGGNRLVGGPWLRWGRGRPGRSGSVKASLAERGPGVVGRWWFRRKPRRLKKSGSLVTRRVEGGQESTKRITRCWCLWGVANIALLSEGKTRAEGGGEAVDTR